jgi:hypothetical protein
MKKQLAQTTSPESPSERLSRIPGIPVPPLPPPGLDVNKRHLEVMMELVGVPTITTETIPELYRRILIRERLTFSPQSPTELYTLIHKHEGLTVNAEPLSESAFKKNTLRIAWFEAENYAGQYRKKE